MMLDITVKTLDGRNRSFSVPDDITVRQFKEKIASSIEIDADIQRLIFQGRVLDDDKKIDDYNVNGKTVHVVQRSPPSARAAAAAASSGSAAAAGSSEPGPGRDEHRTRVEGNSFVVGSFSLPPDTTDVNQVHNMMRHVLSGIGGDFANNIHTTASTSSADGPSVDVHINLSHGGPPLHSESQTRINQAMHMLSLASNTLDRLERQRDNDSDITDGSDDDAAAAAAAADSSRAAHTTTSSAASNGRRPAAPVEHPPTSALCPVLDEMLRVHGRLQPHLLRYRQLMSDDHDYTDRRSERTSAQRLCNLTSEVLHSLSHVYHHVSDLMVDMSRAPPRQLRAAAPMPTTAAIIQQTIPVHINVAHVPVSTMVSTNESATTSSGSGVTMTTASQSQQPQPQQATTTTSSSVPFVFPPVGAIPQFRMGPSSSGVPIPNPGGMPQGMHVFMDVAPGMGFRPFGTQAAGSTSVTSSTATSTDTSSAAGSRTAPSTGQAAAFPPGDFLQNIFQMATNGGFRGQSGQPGASRWMSMSSQSTSASRDATRPTSSSDSVTSSSSSAATSSASSSSAASGTSQNIGPIPAGVGGFPGIPPMGMPPPLAVPPGAIPADLLPVDPCLPCHSHHFVNRRAQTAAGPTAAAAAAADQNQEQNLAGMVSNLVSSIVGPISGMGPPVDISQVRAGSASTQSSAPMSSSSSDSTAASPSATSSSSSSTSASTNATSGAGSWMAGFGLPGTMQLPDLLQALHGQTIAEFLSSINMEYTPAQGEGLLADLFHIVATHMMFTDLTMVFFGMSAPLEHLRQPLQQFVSESVMNGVAVSDANVESAVERLLRGIQPDIDSVSELPTRNGIDFLATLTQFLRVNLRRAIYLISTASAESGFAASLYELCRRVVHEFVVLSRHCLEGGQTALEALLQDRLRSFSSDVSPAMQTMICNMAVQQLRLIVPLIRLTDADILRYVVTGSATATATADSVSSDNSFESACDAVTEDATEHDENVPMDDQSESDSAAAAARPSAVSASLLSQLPAAPQTDMQDSDTDMQLSYGSQDWHSAVPTEWIPVITRDITRQRRQAPQPSFSDAYISGMPSKRRKVMRRDRQRDEVTSSTSVVISEALKRAAQRAGAQPTTSHSELTQDVTDNSALCAAFQHEMNTAIAHRLTNDTDYMPDKYPNITKFFKSE